LRLLIGNHDYNVVLEQLTELVPTLPKLTSLSLPQPITNKLSFKTLLPFLKSCSDKLSLRDFEFKSNTTTFNEDQRKQILTTFLGWKMIKSMKLEMNLLTNNQNSKLIKIMLTKPHIRYLELITNNLSNEARFQWERMNCGNCVLKLD